MTVLAMHSRSTPSWGSPPWLIELGRRVLGGTIDLDLATSEFWNTHGVQAPRYFTEEDNALADRDWSEIIDRLGGQVRIWCNPPGLGGPTIRAFWRLCRRLHDEFEGASVFWVGFSVEQISYLQREAGGLGERNGAPFAIPPRRIAYMQHPRDYHDKLVEKAARIREKRGEALAWDRIHAKLDWLEREHGLDGPPLKGEQPTHSSWLALLPSSAVQVERFKAEMAAISAEVW